MVNPYSSPPATPALPAENARTRNSGVLGWVAAAVAVVAIVTFAAAAVILLQQGSRLASESAGLPARFQSGNDGLVWGSRLAGLTALAGVGLNIVALLFLRRSQLWVSIALIGISIVAAIAVAILFKPS